MHDGYAGFVELAMELGGKLELASVLKNHCSWGEHYGYNESDTNMTLTFNTCTRQCLYSSWLTRTPR